jgi:transposase-like protein
MSRILVECGEALYGPRWQSELARDLGVADRTVRRWVAGTSDVPAGLYVDLLRITQERAAALDALAERLRETGAP